MKNYFAPWVLISRKKYLEKVSSGLRQILATLSFSVLQPAATLYIAYDIASEPKNRVERFSWFKIIIICIRLGFLRFMKMRSFIRVIFSQNPSSELSVGDTSSHVDFNHRRKSIFTSRVTQFYKKSLEHLFEAVSSKNVFLNNFEIMLFLSWR